MTELRGDRVVLRPLQPDDAPALRAAHSSPEVERWWGMPPDDFPFDDEPTATRLAVTVDGEVRGLIQYTEDPEPEGRNAELDVFLDPDHLDRGLGADAVATLVRHLMDDRGHHRVILSTAVDNARAIRCYEKVGFRRVGITEASWHHPTRGWLDEVLMERVVRP